MFGIAFRITPVVKALILVNFVIFVLDNLSQNIISHNLALSYRALIDHYEIYKLVSYQFLHAGFGHIFGNMILLFFFGPELETIWGSKNFLSLYLVSGILAGLAEVILSSQDAGVIGASGAVMAIFTAFTIYFPNREILIWFLFPLKIKYLFLFYLISDLSGIIGYRSDGIAHLAHLAGVLSGFIYVKYIFSGYSKTKRNNFVEEEESIFDKFSQAFNKKDNQSHWKMASKKDEFDSDRLRYYRRIVDDLLDKINQVGYLRLTDDERKQLEEASDYLKRYDSH